MERRKFEKPRNAGETRVNKPKFKIPFGVGVAAISVLTACSDSSNADSNLNSVDAGMSRPDVFQSDDVNTTDAGNMQDVDTGFDSNEVDADLVTDVDAAPDSSSDADSTGLSDAADVIDIEAEVSLPDTFLRVRNNGGPINVIEQNPAESHFLANFELCADGSDTLVSSVSLNTEGRYDNLVVVSEFAGELANLVLNDFDDTLTLNPSAPFLILDGECTDLQVILNNENISENDFWTNFSLYSVGASATEYNVKVVRALDSIGVSERYPVKGVHTVLNSEAELYARVNLDEGLDVPITVTRDSSYFTIGRYQVDTERNGLASVTEFSFGFNLEPSDAVFPVNFDAYIYDRVIDSSFNLDGDLFIERDGGMIPISSSIVNIRDEDVLIWRSTTSEGVDLSFGSNVGVEFRSVFVPDTIDTARVSMNTLDSEADIVIRDNGWGSTPDDFPLLANLYEFIEPVPTENVVLVEMQTFAPRRAEYFAWRNDFDGIIRETGCSVYGCSLFDAYVRFNGDLDRLNPTTLNSFSVSVESFTDFDLSFNYMLVSGNPEDFDYAVHRRGSFELAGYSDFSLDLVDLAFDLNRDNDTSFAILIDLADEDFPLIETTTLDTESIQFTLNSIDVSQGEAVLPITIDGRLPLDFGEYDYYGLPFLLPEIIFNAPVILNSENSIAPVTIDERTYEAGVPVVIFDSEWLNVFGEVQVCSINFSHDIDKTSPPFASLSLNLNGDVAVLTNWTRIGAEFEFPADNCPRISSGNNFEILVEGTNPTFSDIERTLRGRFVMFYIDAFSPRSEDHVVPAVVDYDIAGDPVVLSPENSVRGPLVTFNTTP